MRHHLFGSEMLCAHAVYHRTPYLYTSISRNRSAEEMSWPRELGRVARRDLNEFMTAFV